MKIVLLILLTLGLVACNKSGSSGFKGLAGNADPGSGETPPADQVTISSFTPEVDPIVLTTATSQVFAVNVPGGAGDVTYDFIKDDSLTIQIGTESFYTLNGSSLTAGAHTLKVVAKNQTSQAEKIFNIRKNTPTAIVSPAPSSSGTSINCGTSSLVFSSFLSDVDVTDTKIATWYLDTMPVTGTTPFATVNAIVPNYTALTYSPACTTAGSHILQLRVFDGYETTETSWSFTVTNPPPLPGTVHISSFTPTISPVVLTNTSNVTFGATVDDGAGTITYDFSQDLTTQLQSGGTSFYNLSGSTLTAGSHSIKIYASNGLTHDEKVFSIRKNTPPNISFYNPSLTGGNLNCSGGSQTIEASIGDLDLDPINVKWKVDNTLVTSSSPFVTTTRTDGSISLIYAPDCSKAGVHSFQLILSDGFEEVSQTWSVTVNNPPPPPGTVQISSFTPTITPVVLTKVSNMTFGVSVSDGAGAVNYAFTLDGVTNLQAGSTSFYNLSGTSLAAGAHSIKVVASNGTSQAEKIFSIRKNTSPGVTYYSPSLSGTTLNCGTGSQTLQANISDIDNDSVSIKWKLDNAIVNSNTPFVTLSDTSSIATLSYAPDCTKNGVHLVELTLNDGYEDYTQTWTLTVNNPPPPPGDVKIISFTPSTNPSVITNSSNLTMGITVADGAGTVTYNFKLDGTTTLQAGSTTFYNLAGHDLTPGTHTIKALATNGITSDEKNFTIRKNTPPLISFYSPSLNGGSLNCSGGAQTLQANLSDVDLDTINVKWKVDSTLVTPTTPFVTTTSTSSSTNLTYTPDCTKAGVHSFQLILSDGFDEISQTWSVTVNNPPPAPGAVQIISFTPTVTPVVMTKDSSVTFGVSVPDGVGSVNYIYSLDNTTTLQSSTASFYSLLGSTLSAGTHSVKVVASNGSTQDEKNFSIRKNTPPSISFYTPALTGASLNCSSGSQRLDANILDLDNDAIIVKWKIDNSLVTSLTQFVSTTNTSGAVSLTYTPDCTKTGIHLVELVLNDGYEEYSQTWTVTVNNPPPPPGIVKIQSYIPTTTPAVITSTTNLTFGVTVAEGAGTITYNFLLDGSSTLQTGATTFYTLPGSGLSAGTHTVKATATNGITSDEKNFSIRKNTPPALSFYTPALTGTSIGCTGNQNTKIEANLIDVDADSMTTTWKVDDVAVTPATSFTSSSSSSNYSSLTYTPDCTAVGTHKFQLTVSDGYESFTQTWVTTVTNPPTPPGNVQIVSVSPTTSSLVMTNSSSATFGVTIADGSGTVLYDFIEDSSVTRQTGSIPYYALNGSTLAAGPHKIKVVARNSTSQDFREFNVRKNTPPNFSATTPTLTGASFNCTGGSTTLKTTVADSDGDTPLTIRWFIDDALVTATTDFANFSRTGDQAQLIYAPDCTKVGTHNIQIKVSDGFEETSQSWTVTVNNPPATIGNVVIFNYTPAAATTIMTATSSTTFAVSIQDGAGVVTYEFKLDDVTVGTPGTTPYLILNGSDLTEGTHILRVKASNSVSYQEKSFNLRRNALPVFSSFSPGLSGTSANCGSGTVSFDGTVVDSDAGTTLRKTWLLDNVEVTNSAPTYAITDNPNYGKMIYQPDCTKTGVHTMSLKVFDGYEYSTLAWSFTINNPAQETLGVTSPSGSNVVALSTESTKTFTASAQTGIPPYTFVWKIKRSGVADVVKLTESNVTSSSLILNTTSDLIFGDQTVEVTLTDSVSTNNPASPAARSWTLYRNQKPQITSLSPSLAKKINSNTTLALSAIITDAADTFTSSITRGASLCSPASSCGLSSVTAPTATGTFSANFKSGTTFIGDNAFTITVTDAHGESSNAQFNVNANFFTDTCNSLSAGKICTLAGMPGLGEDLDITLSDNQTKVKIHPFHIVPHDVGAANKNFIITDQTLHVVFYWNRNAQSLQLGPYSINANSVKAIIGAAGFNQNTSAATSFGSVTTTNLRNFFLNTPYGVSVSSSGTGTSMVTNIFIAEQGLSRILKVQFNNASGGSASLLQSAGLGCVPYGLALDSVNASNTLYVSCYASNLIRTLNVSSATAFATTAAGATTAAASLVAASGVNPSADGAVPGTATTLRALGLSFDPVDKLLYMTELNPYRVRVYNPNASSATVLNTIAPANSITSLVGTGALGATVGPFASTTFGNLMHVLPYRIGGALKGLFVTDYTYHRVVFLNNTASSITLGNNTIAGYNSGVVFGFNNTTGANNNNGTLSGGKSSQLNTPYGMVVDGGGVFISDNGNSRLRKLVVDDNAATPALIANGTVSNALGSLPKSGYNESATLQAQQAQFSSPSFLKFDSTNNRILISDTGNKRIRTLNLATGVVDTLIGSGNGGNQTGQVNPLQAIMNTSRDVEILKYAGLEYLLYVDANPFLRALNQYGDLENILGTDTDPGKTNTFAGTSTISQWTAANLPLYNNQPAAVTPLYTPAGMGADGPANTVYVSDTSDHCIKKIDGSGIISVFAGLCATAGNSGGSFSTARFNNPWDIEMDPLYSGNFFVVDLSNAATSYIKYVNNTSSAKSIMGTIVAANSIANLTFSVTPNYTQSIAVNNDQLCFTNGQLTGATTFGTQSVVCFNRAGNGSLSLYVGNRNSPDISVTGYFRGRMPAYLEDEGIGMGWGSGLDPYNLPVQLSDPQGLAFDAEGNLYISEARGHAIRMVKRWY